MKMFKVFYLLVGVVLAAIVLVNAMKGIPDEDRRLYDAAVGMEARADSEIWPGLRITGFPVAIRKGSTEYVLWKGNTEKRRPALPVVACTAYPVDGEMNVFLPCKSELASIGQIAEGLSSDMQGFLVSRFQVHTENFSDTRYVAILYHETLHAWQFKHYREQLERIRNGGNGTFHMDDETSESLLTEIEADSRLSSLYARQNYQLAVLSDPASPILERGKVLNYLETREEIRKVLSEKMGVEKAACMNRFADYTELVEGTARYVEYRVALSRKEEGLQKQYLSSLQETAQGKEKYYRSGMGLCMLLDKKDPGWQREVFEKTTTLEDLLENILEESVNG